jgi:small subunit ribosomal protein S6
MVILDAGLEEDAIRSTLDRTTKIISGGGGTVGRVDRWGRRRFAYEVRGVIRVDRGDDLT